MRFCLGILYGCWLGVGTARSNSGANLIFGLNFVSFVPIVYCTIYLGADSDSYENKLLFSGVLNSVALLLLVWIYFYTAEHEDDEQILSAALKTVLGAATGSVSEEAGEATMNPPVVEDSEF